MQSIDNFVLFTDDLPEVLDLPLGFPKIVYQALFPLDLVSKLIAEIFFQYFLLV